MSPLMHYHAMHYFGMHYHGGPTALALVIAHPVQTAVLSAGLAITAAAALVRRLARR